MPAPVIEFHTAIAARRDDDGLAISLFDGTLDGDAACVAILLCADPAGMALVLTLCSALKLSTPQPLIK